MVVTGLRADASPVRLTKVGAEPGDSSTRPGTAGDVIASQAMAFFTRLLGFTALAALAFPVACGSAPIRRPNVPAGSKVQELRHAAGDGAQDCGEVVEPKGGDTTCSVHPIGECVAAALKDCRA